MQLNPIAHITTAFPEKFGVPRQAGLAKGVYGYIEFLREYRSEELVRGLEGFSHIWLIWGFSENRSSEWHPTVRPPRLGGNERIGVLATRSPIRPNPIGLSCLRLVEIRKGPVLVVEAPDLVSGTPIYDIKPYIPYADCHPEATGGFTAEHTDYNITVEIPASLKAKLDERTLTGLISVLSQDPRPAFHHDPDRIYGLSFSEWEVKFKVAERTCLVLSIEKRNQSS